MSNDLREKISWLKDKTVLVVGDLILDKYILGQVERLSPEAPVPVLNVEKEEFRLGGAANAAHNIQSLGCQAVLVGLVGSDKRAEQFKSLLRQENIKDADLISTPEIPTILKERVVGEKHYIRIDYEKVLDKLPSHLQKNLIETTLRVLPETNAIVFSDYGKGVVSKELFESVLNKSRELNIPVVINAKPRKNAFYHDVDLIIVNEKEAKELARLTEETKDISSIGKKLATELKSRILITQSEKGMTLFENERVVYIPALADQVVDVSGAGDTISATIASSLASGIKHVEACVIASQAAAQVVGIQGTATVKKNDLMRTLNSNQAKIKTVEELEKIAGDLKEKGKTIVFTNGIFDLFSPEQFETIRQAKTKGDILIVAVNSDRSVQKIKGGNPFLSQAEREKIISSLKETDFILFFDELDVQHILKIIKPDVYVKGSNYAWDSINEKEKRILQDIGSEVDFVHKMINESLDIKNNLNLLSPKIKSFADELIAAFKKGKKVMVCGNGGSASDAQHFQAELIGRFRKNRRGLPCIALTDHPSLLTALSNDFGFEAVFEKQVEALGQTGDVLVTLSTSGCSPNIIRVLKKAREIGMKTIGLSGNEGGKMNDYTDLNLIVNSKFSARIQESHITIIHIVSELVEKALFPETE